MSFKKNIIQTASFFCKFIFLGVCILTSEFAFSQAISKIGYTQEGNASYYPDNRNGAYTRSGERYSMYALEGAHQYIAFNSLVKVTNLDNNKEVYVRINDRPYTNSRILDLTLAAAKKLDMVGKPTTKVRIEIIANNNFRDNSYNSLVAQNNQVIQNTTPVTTTTSKFPTSIAVSKDLSLDKLEKIFAPVHTYTLSGQTVSPKGWGIQIGSFNEIKTAMEKAERLEQLQFKNIFIQSGWANKNKIYRVILGDFDKKEDAKEVESYIKNHYKGIFVKSHMLNNK
ncbi:septal ring lytic transglycosylase RlpA family protein [Chondrinema litorale]|uniref:septal ring lytic transglycosylase RlpA family protein n=1 Tax=Chondrinema litorale TaxID=2994555 RepID=UPI00254486E8|nr:SPOR domain-containing protein [Chondrinema litorale]UZR92980.1 septal ring lytic transglycosylase RlpA family protein [Chondrinema litorale]